MRTHKGVGSGVNSSKRQQAAEVFGQLYQRLGTDQAVATQVGISPGQANQLRHGKTMATNAIRARGAEVLQRLQAEAATEAQADDAGRSTKTKPSLAARVGQLKDRDEVEHVVAQVAEALLDDLEHDNGPMFGGRHLSSAKEAIEARTGRGVYLVCLRAALRRDIGVTHTPPTSHAAQLTQLAELAGPHAEDLNDPRALLVMGNDSEAAPIAKRWPCTDCVLGAFF